jgi:sirohydrochlorin cobaltochelatase
MKQPNSEQSAHSREHRPRPLGVRHAALAVQNIERALQFYQEELDFEVYYSGDSDWAMLHQCGTTLSVVLGHSERQDTHSSPSGSHPDHLGITLASREQVDAWNARLQSRGIPCGKPVLHRDKSYGFYLKDPDGHIWELIFIPARKPEPSHTGILLVAHGSSDSRWRAPFESWLNLARASLNGQKVELGYMEFCGPHPLEAAQVLLSDPNIQSVRVVPLFMSGGGHVQNDFPEMMESLKSRFPKVEFELAPAIGESPGVREAMLHALLG